MSATAEKAADTAPDATVRAPAGDEPTRPGGNGAWKRRFLDAYEESQLVTEACKQAGIERSTAYRARKSDAEFAREWDELDEAAIEELEKVAMKRATEGSDRLVEFILKAKRPDVYRERLSIEDDRVKRERQAAEQLSDEELDERLAGVTDGGIVVPISEAGARRRGR